MYYQVLIETTEKIGKSRTNKQLFELDKIDKNEVLNDIVMPFLLKKELQFDGYFLKASDILRMVIKTTEKSARDLSQYENDNMPTGVIMYVSPQDIVDYDKHTTDVTKDMINEAKSLIDEPEVKQQKIKIEKDRTKVFIVHGHDNSAKTEVARFVEKLGFEAIILHEQASGGKTVIEKIEAHSNVGFGVVLYTPCDVGAEKGSEDQLKPRARQNVVFEHGYLIGKIGRNNVCALIKNEIEKPNDISGVVYIQMDSYNAWNLALAKELKSAGYDIDMNLIL